jgi:hydroxymethylpyrimidine pyrophosphatase-like HAD family hydrolase
MKKALIIDLDGTLADIEHRRHFVEKKEGSRRDFKAFEDAIPKDRLNQWCAEIIDRFKRDHSIIFVTGRMWNEATARLTRDWLFQKGIDYNFIFARKDQDFRPDTEVKKEIFENEIKGKYDVTFCVDDRSSVVKMWRSIGLTCLQCDEGDF